MYDACLDPNNDNNICEIAHSFAKECHAAGHPVVGTVRLLQRFHKVFLNDKPCPDFAITLRLLLFGKSAYCEEERGEYKLVYCRLCVI